MSKGLAILRHLAVGTGMNLSSNQCISVHASSDIILQCCVLLRFLPVFLKVITASILEKDHALLFLDSVSKINRWF
jgi:hypothetical protein